MEYTKEELEARVEELEKENAKLVDSLEYYVNAKEALDRAADILNRAMDGEAELTAAADRYDDYTFKKETEMVRRENKIKEDEAHAKAAIAKARDMKNNSTSYIEKEAKSEIEKYKSKGIKTIVAITAIYTVLFIMIYLLK